MKYVCNAFCKKMHTLQNIQEIGLVVKHCNKWIKTKLNIFNRISLQHSYDVCFKSSFKCRMKEVIDFKTLLVNIYFKEYLSFFDGDVFVTLCMIHCQMETLVFWMWLHTRFYRTHQFFEELDTNCYSEYDPRLRSANCRYEFNIRF